MAQFSAEELTLITKEALAHGFPNATRFLKTQAGLYRLRIQYRAGAFDGQMAHADWAAFGAKIAARSHEPAHEFTTKGLGALVFADGSLYYASNAADEVWRDGEDFCRELPQEPEWRSQDEQAVWAHYGMGE